MQPSVDSLRFGSAPEVANAMLSNSLGIFKIFQMRYEVRIATDRVLVRVYGQDEPIEGGVAAISLDEAEKYGELVHRPCFPEQDMRNEKNFMYA